MLLAERYGERGVIFDASGGGAAFNQQNFKFDREQCLNVRVLFCGCGSSRLGWCEQGLLDDHQIGQGEQGVELGGVLGQPAMT